MMNGVDPAALGRLGYWEYVLMIQGWNAANAGEDAPIEPPTAAEYRDMVERLG